MEVMATTLAVHSFIPPSPSAHRRPAFSPQLRQLPRKLSLSPRASSVNDVGKLALASLVTGIGNAQSALALAADEAIGNLQESAFESLNSDVPEAIGNLQESASEALNIDVSEAVGNLQQSASEALNFDVPEIDTSALSDFLNANPLAVIVGGVILVLPLVVSTVLRGNYGPISAKDAYAKLGDKELATQILDIRVGDDIRAEGTPDLKILKKKVTQVPYIDDAGEFVPKALSKFKDAENTTVYILDRFDGNSSTVAKWLAKGGFKAAYAIKDGAEGPKGWKSSKLPWLVPSKGFALDLEKFKDLFTGSDTGSLVPATLGVAAAAGVGLVVFSEAETALQLLGSAALLQLFVRKFLFAKDRKKTLEELKVFLDTKVAPKEIVEELKGIGAVLLPKFEEVKAASVNGSAILENTLEDAPEASPIESTPETTVESVPGEEREPTTDSIDLPRTPKPLSPYPQYPDLKPPTSPTPSRP